MTIKKVNVGVTPDDGNGDKLRDAFIKCNDSIEHLNTEQSKKANASELENYATKTALTSGLAGKIDNSAFELLQTSVAEKANQVQVDAALALKADQIDLEALELRTGTTIADQQQEIGDLTIDVDNHESRIVALEAGGGDGSIDVEPLVGNGLQAVAGKLTVKAGSGITVSSAGVAVSLSQGEGGSSNSGLVIDAGRLKIDTNETLEVNAQNKLALSQLILSLIDSKLDESALISKASIYVGEQKLFPFRVAELPPGWYFTNGDNYLLSSPQGQALNSLSANYRSDWRIVITTISGQQYINVPNFFGGAGGYFERAVNGTSRLPGGIQNDATRNATGAATAYSYKTGGMTGVFGGYVSAYAALPSGVGNPDFNFVYFNLDLSRQIPTASEIRPLNIGKTPAIYLGV